MNIDTGMPDGAVSVYQNDSTDEFPVLKAFQQYIDAEQAKARKRMIMLCAFFSLILIVVISVFVVLLISSFARTQTLNDRLVEYAMKDRNREPIVQQQDNAAIRSLSAKLDALDASLAAERKRAEKSAAETSEVVEKKNKLSRETLEIERLKALLAVEKEKAAAEREKQRQAELELYRRKHYPELYGEKSVRSVKDSRAEMRRQEEAADREIEQILQDAQDVQAISYFDDEDDGENVIPKDKPVSEKNKPGEQAEKPPRAIKDSAGREWEMPLE